MGDFVFGRPIAGSTRDAIDIKQRLLGERYDPEAITLARHYFNARSPWVRLSSGVRLDDLEKAEYFGVGLGNQLARENILTSFDEYENTSLLDSTVSDYYGGTYGIGRPGNVIGTVSYDELGPRPRPGITNVTTTVHGMYGSLKTTTVNFKCWTPFQLDILDVLYMRPGYTVVLEMGHSHYVKENEFNSFELYDDIIPIDLFSDSYISEEANNFNKIYQDIVKKRAEYTGAYEAVVGVIKNFTWALQTDGSYNCAIDIVSKGELVDSLVLNIGKATTEEKTPEPTVMHRQLRKLHNYDDKVTFVAEPTKRGEGAWHYLEETFFKELVDTPEKSKFVDRRFSYVYKQRFDLSEEVQTYITFSLLNSVLNKYMLKQGTGLAEDSYLALDTDFVDKKYYTSNLHLSINPLVCLLPKSTASGGIFPDIKIQPRPLQPQDSLSIGEILLNVNFILETASANLDEKGTLKIQDFFNSIFSGIEKSTGGINHFDLHSDDNSTMYILDRRDIGVSAEPESNIEIYGLSSMVKGLNLASKLSPKLSTTIAVSAQNEPSKLGIEATSFRTLNRGVVDSISNRRVVTQDISREFNFVESEESDEVAVELTETLKKIREGINTIYVEKGSVKENYGEIFASYSNLLHNSFESVRTPQASFAIPFELQLTLDGTAGFVVGETFTISGDILPVTYKRILETSDNVKIISQDTKVGFIITGVEQQISNGDWSTIVRSQIYLTGGKDVIRKTYKIKSEIDSAKPKVVAETADTNYNPVLERVRTETTQETLASKINRAIPNEPEPIKAGVLFLARQEQNLKGFNHNYYGVMADIGRWTGGDTYFNGSFPSTEGAAGEGVRTTNIRYFASFDSDESGIKFIANTLKRKKWQNVTEATIAETYYKTWLSPANPDALIAKDGGRKGRLWKDVLTSIRTA